MRLILAGAMVRLCARRGSAMLAALSAGTVLGCASPSMPAADPIDSVDGSPISQPISAVFRGHFVFGHEVRIFRACGGADPVWVSDSTGRLWALHQELARASAPYQRVFGVVRGTLGDPPDEGFGADYGQQLVVADIQYMAAERFGCDQDGAGFAVRAYGNEPF